MAYKDLEKYKAWREANREKLRAQSKKYREANPEKLKAYREAYREANREEVRARDKVYREANREKLNACNKSYREVNREKVKAHREAYIKNPMNASRNIIYNLTGLKKAEIPTELLEAQALIIQIHREIKNHEKLHRA